ncbi:hypothetical protein ACRC6Q_18955 [Planococcus sp. SE5232]|uniref:hypothetical protein n=1 Tax=unclassified Planococcus (in: firmicutes) TaxID=2662419 RepID=UPI003D6C2923
MKSYRVTKYNPQYRNEKGVYVKEEWISIFNIGKMYEGKIFTYEEYLETEDKYIAAIKIVMKDVNLESMQIKDLELSSHRSELTIKEGEHVSFSDIDVVARMVLRGELWCILRANDLFEVHFGYDYYMYFVGEALTPEVINKISHIKGLYVEEMISPYL